MSVRGRVWLVGAGPGDAGLITVKGLQVLQSADVVIYDRLAPAELLREARDDAELIDAGKERGAAKMDQAAINAAMVKHASAGKRVCRLKGGDPFVFGRGGEEALALGKAGVHYEVVPGVSSAFAVPAYAGIPVTHRGMARACIVATGSIGGDEPEASARIADEDQWRQLAQVDATVTVLMGATRLAEITDALIRHGRDAAEPAAVIERGTTTRQRAVTGTLRDIAQLATNAGIRAPAVLTIGEVVSLADRIDWRAALPLSGRRVLVSRARSSASRLAAGLRDAGADVVEAPAIRMEPLTDFSELDDVLRAISRYDWMSFASRNAVSQVFARLSALGNDARRLAGVKVAAIGSATAEELLHNGVRADLVPQDYSSEGLLAEFRQMQSAPERVLAFKSDIGRESVMAGLSQLGAEVDMVAAYRTVPDSASATAARDAYAAGVDATTFTSSSTVDNLLDMLGDDAASVNRGLVCCIGPITADTAQRRGLRVDVVPAVHTIDALVDAIVERFGTPTDR